MKYSLLFIFTLGAFICFGQDMIMKSDGSRVNAKVTKVGTEVIEYKNADNPDGPSYEVLKSDVIKIVYKNGYVEDIHAESEKVIFQEKFDNAANSLNFTQNNYTNTQVSTIDGVFHIKILRDHTKNKLLDRCMPDIHINFPRLDLESYEVFSLEFDAKFNSDLDIKPKWASAPYLEILAGIKSDIPINPGFNDYLSISYDFLSKKATGYATLGVKKDDSFGALLTEISNDANHKQNETRWVANDVLNKNYKVQSASDTAWCHFKISKSKYGFQIFINNQMLSEYYDKNLPPDYDNLREIYIRGELYIKPESNNEVLIDNLLVKGEKRH